MISLLTCGVCGHNSRTPHTLADCIGALRDERNALDVAVAAKEERIKDLERVVAEATAWRKDAEAVHEETRTSLDAARAWLDGKEHRHESGKVCVACYIETDEPEAEQVEKERDQLRTENTRHVQRWNELTHAIAAAAPEKCQCGAGAPVCYGVADGVLVYGCAECCGHGESNEPGWWCAPLAASDNATNCKPERGS